MTPLSTNTPSSAASYPVEARAWQSAMISLPVPSRSDHARFGRHLSQIQSSVAGIVPRLPASADTRDGPHPADVSLVRPAPRNDYAGCFGGRWFFGEGVRQAGEAQ